MADRSPNQIRDDIEQTREELGETVEALARKTDVKGNARAKVQDSKERAQATVHAVRQRIGSSDGGSSSASFDGANGSGAAEIAREKAQQVKAAAAANPVAARVLGAFAAGLLIGLLVARR